MIKQTKWQGEDQREKRKDFFFRLLQISSLVGWILFFLAAIVFHFARPELETGVQRFWGMETRSEWDATLLPWLLALLVVCVLLSLLGAILRVKRARRVTDRKWSNFYFLLVAAASGLALIWLGY